jgi:hypothetical protein
VLQRQQHQQEFLQVQQSMQQMLRCQQQHQLPQCELLMRSLNSTQPVVAAAACWPTPLSPIIYALPAAAGAGAAARTCQLHRHYQVQQQLLLLLLLLVVVVVVVVCHQMRKMIHLPMYLCLLG